jgi:hypothetical protein
LYTKLGEGSQPKINRRVDYLRVFILRGKSRNKHKWRDPASTINTGSPKDIFGICNWLGLESEELIQDPNKDRYVL